MKLQEKGRLRLLEITPSGEYRVTDHSHNGAFYSNQRIPSDTPYILPRNSILVIGTPDNVIELQ